MTIMKLFDEFIDDMKYCLDKFIDVLEEHLYILDEDEVNEILFIYNKYWEGI